MHTNPEVLALVALGEREAASSEDLDHIAHCPSCERELSELGHLSRSAGPSPITSRWRRRARRCGTGSGTSSASARSSPPIWCHPPPPTRGPAIAAAAPSPRRLPAPDSPATAAAPESPATRPSSRFRLRRTTRAHRRHRCRHGRARSGSTGPHRAGVGCSASPWPPCLALLAGIGGTLAWQQFTANDTVVTSAPLQALPDWSGAAGEVTLEEDAAGRPVPGDHHGDPTTGGRDPAGLVGRLHGHEDDPDRAVVPGGAALPAAEGSGRDPFPAGGHLRPATGRRPRALRQLHRPRDPAGLSRSPRRGLADRA